MNDHRRAILYLAEAYGQTWTEERIMVWLDQLQAIQAPLVERAARAWVAKNQRAPTPAGILELCAAIRIEDLSEQRRRDQIARDRQIAEQAADPESAKAKLQAIREILKGVKGIP